MIAALLAALLSAAPAQAAASGPPAELRPARVIGAGFYVRDLEAEKAWYVGKLGMAVLVAYPQYHEYVLGYGVPGGAILNLQASDKRPPGRNYNGRLILGVANAKALAAWLKGQGVDTFEGVKDVAYFAIDPEGNAVELYTAPAAR